MITAALNKMYLFGLIIIYFHSLVYVRFLLDCKLNSYVKHTKHTLQLNFFLIVQCIFDASFMCNIACMGMRIYFMETPEDGGYFIVKRSIYLNQSNPSACVWVNGYGFPLWGKFNVV